jgi:hypothetical protein
MLLTYLIDIFTCQNGIFLATQQSNGRPIRNATQQMRTGDADSSKTYVRDSVHVESRFL